MLRTTLIGFVSIVATAALAQQGPQDEGESSSLTAQEWSDAARADILFAYDEFVQNHPGIYDLENPDFPGLLAQARSRGLDAADQARDRNGYARAIAEFSAVLQDGHALAAIPRREAGDSSALWPGFVARWLGDGLFIRTQDPQDRLHGAKITACDDMPIEKFLRDRLTMQYFRPAEKGQWWFRASAPFYSFNGLLAGSARACEVTLQDGREQAFTLEWVPMTQQQREWILETLNGEREPTELVEKRGGIFFVGLQTFQPDDAGREAFEQLYKVVEARREDLLEARALVLDLRYNGGGNSAWSRRLADVLWGKEALDDRYDGADDVLWRASPDNIAHVRSLVERVRTEVGEQQAEYWDAIAAGMSEAGERGEPLFSQMSVLTTLEDQSSSSTAKAISPSPVPTDFETPVYVIVPGYCASACLDALDYFTRFDNTRLIGAPSSADSTYMEARKVELPAGPGFLIIPNKVYVGRLRGWGEYYPADIEMRNLDWSTESFLDRIEQDLAGR